MLKDITLGQYYPVKSPLHKLDPRVKILLVFAFIILLFFVQNFVGYIVFAVFTGIIIKLSRVPLKFMLKGLKPLFFIMIFTAVLNLFMVQGDHVTVSYTHLDVYKRQRENHVLPSVIRNRLME